MSHPGKDGQRKANPFARMNITDHRFLAAVADRQACPDCQASRKYFCYTCYQPLPDLRSAFPHVRLPVRIDIVKHSKEVDGKSTSAHARILAPDDCRIFVYPDIPDYSHEPGTVLIYPSHKSNSVQSLFTGVQHLDRGVNFGLPEGHSIGTLLRFRLAEVRLDEATGAGDKAEPMAELPVRRAVFIDSTWNQSRSIYKDPRINRLPCVVLQNRLSQFWRHQKGSPRWFLSTVEAIHQFLLEVHVHAWGLDAAYAGLEHLEIGGPFAADVVRRLHRAARGQGAAKTAPYNGQYDDLLFLFAHMYDLIHRYYDHHTLKAYKRPID